MTPWSLSFLVLFWCQNLTIYIFPNFRLLGDGSFTLKQFCPLGFVLMSKLNNLQNLISDKMLLWGVFEEGDKFTGSFGIFFQLANVGKNSEMIL